MATTLSLCPTRPLIPGLKAFRAHGQPDEPLAANVTGVRHYESVAAVLARIPDRSAYVRDAVRDRMIRDGLIDGQC